MNSMGVRATLAVLLVIATAEAAEETVAFWKKDFTMTCPQDGVWFKNQEGKPLQNGTTVQYTDQYNGKTKGQYYCEYSDVSDPDAGADIKIRYYFYVKGKVCENCYELNAATFGVAIAMDVVGTAVLMMIIFKFTKKKSSAGLTQAPKTPARPGGRDPNVQSPHYEPLNTHTRSEDPYSVVNRMG